MIIIDKGENVGNTIKLVSGFILFVIGVLLAYETIVYNLLGVLLIVGLIISIVGIIMIVSYFVDSNADRTTNMIKDFLESREDNNSSFGGLDRKSDNDKRPLKVRNDFNEYEDGNYEELELDDLSGLDDNKYYDDYYENNPKAVLKVVPQEEKELNLDKKLNFTPHYDKPLKVTRAPKKREDEYIVEEVPEILVNPNNNSQEIQTALQYEQPIVEPVIDTTSQVAPEVAQNRDIKIDINNPESLPLPKSLRSFIISGNGLISSQEAFDNLAVNVNKEIMLEIPSLNDLSDRFLSHVPTIYSRVIINEFDVSEMSYMFLISSLLKQGVHIKTVPKVHSINLITDDSHALIISGSTNDMQYGAIYEDRNSISNIRADFEKTWNIASNLDENLIMSQGGVA